MQHESTSAPERLRSARLAAGYARVADFAPVVGLSRPTIYRIERGQPPSVGTLRRWAEACGCSADYLLGLDEAAE